MLEAGQRVKELVEKIYKMKKYLVGFIVEQCCIVEHACIMTKMGLKYLTKDPKCLMGVQAQWAGGQVEIPCLLPSQNVGVQALNTVVWGSEGV